MRYIILLLVILPFGLYAQTTPADTIEKVLVDHADRLEGELKDGIEYQYLKGNVELRQGNIFMYCDSGMIVQNNVSAQGNVVIQQSDSTSIFADSLYYDGNRKKAYLYSDAAEVVLVNGKQRLFTKVLEYDLNTKVARYTSGALLDNERSQLKSTKGQYFVDQNEVFFKDSVVVIDSLFTLKSDTLKYNTKTEVATFLAPTIIIQNESKIYCESGFYDIRNEIAEFSQRAQYQRTHQKATADIIRYDGSKQEIRLIGDAFVQDSTSTATADVIRYDEVRDISHLEGNARFVRENQVVTADVIVYDRRNDTYTTSGRSFVQDSTQLLYAENIDFDNASGLGLAHGDVFWKDTAQNIIIITDSAYYDNSTGYLLAVGGRPLFMSILDGDTLFMTSDTLESLGENATSDSSRHLRAYHNVRIFKSDLQGLCDSLVYQSGDSLFRMFYDPIMWSDTSQFTADTILIQMTNNKMDKIHLRQNAIILSTADQQYFDQIRGRNITATLDSGEIRKMHVVGNTESVYYIKDEDDAYIGPNKVVCSEMDIFFANSQVQEIKFFVNPEGQITPMPDAAHEALKVPGFKWRWPQEERPKSREDL